MFFGDYAIHPDAQAGMKVKIEKAVRDFNLVNFDKEKLDILGETTADALGYVVEGEGDEEELVYEGNNK